MVGFLHSIIKTNKQTTKLLPAFLKRKGSPESEYLVIWKVLFALDVCETKLLEQAAKNSKMAGIIQMCLVVFFF